MNKEMIYIAVDSGKSHTKVAWYERNNPKNLMMTDVFRTTATSIKPSDFFNAGTVIKYDGCYYDVGQNEVKLSSENSKLTIVHELCVYTGIATALIDLDMNPKETHFVKLAINVPLHDFKTNKEKYIDQYKNKVVKLIFNKKPVHFIIHSVDLYYEGSGAIINNNATDEGDYYVIDIGGRNDTHILFSNLRPVKNRNTMTNNGVLPLLQLVANELSAGGYDYDIVDVEKIVKGAKPKPKGFDDIFSRYAKSHVGRIRNQLQTFKLIPDYVTLIISGGGSLILKPFLETEFSSEFKTIFAKSGQFDNVYGGLIKLET